MKRLNKKDNFIVSMIVYIVIGLIFVYGYVYLLAYLFSKDPRNAYKYSLHLAGAAALDIAIIFVMLMLKYLTDRFDFTYEIDESIKDPIDVFYKRKDKGIFT